MNGTGRKEGALADIRVIDLADEMGVYCTKLLADLGADVIKVEKPGGDPIRARGPFFGDEPHPERSIYFFHFSTNKRSITLNLELPDGRDILRRLVATADVMVETFPPGYLEEIGLGYSVLREINPGLILTSITGFGQSGPYKDFKAPDIVGVAMGGLHSVGGFPGEPPNYPGAFQGYHLASTDAAIGTLTALCVRDFTGEGQQVDVSMQESVASSLEGAAAAFSLRRDLAQKLAQWGGTTRRGRQVYRGWNEVFACKDGHILCSPLGGAGWRDILKWMDSEGMAADLKEEKYKEVLEIMADRQMDRQVTAARLDPRKLREYPEEIAHIEQVWQAFLMTHTREELYEGCQHRRVRLMPVNSAEDLVRDPHLIARGFFVDVEHPELGATLKYPGAPYRLSETPWNIAKRAPLIGEHNLEIYQELGFSKEQLVLLKERGVI